MLVRLGRVEEAISYDEDCDEDRPIKSACSERMHQVVSTSHQMSIIFTPDLFIRERG